MGFYHLVYLLHNLVRLAERCYYRRVVLDVLLREVAALRSLRTYSKPDTRRPSRGRAVLTSYGPPNRFDTSTMPDPQEEAMLVALLSKDDLGRRVSGRASGYNPFVDPTLPLAFSVRSGPGVYAVLLGSGISRAAGIPTGWEVTLDLISKLAAASGKAEEAEADPVAWFRGAYEEEPDYSRVIDHLAATPADRQRLLKGYFEPTEEEREEDKKIPTAAHQAISRLAAKDYVKVILTTNFDKLMERALEAEGVNPVVVSTPDAAEGAPPLQHAGCTVVKVHGDYLDDRIKNTPTELASYDTRTDALLGKVFSDYGLIVCGWSADYDFALREAFKRSRTRRYGTYWVHMGEEPGEAAHGLIAFVGGQPVRTSGADDFFGDLLEKVESLEEYGGPHPLTASLAVATTKRYLAENRHRIRLEDLVRRETERLYAEFFTPELYP